MSLYYNAKEKLRNVYRTIDVLLDGDFPLGSGRRALEKLRQVFSSLDEKIDRANRLGDSRAGAQLAYNVNVKVYQTLPILGFILRSTNVRNAFEILDPIQAVADSVLQGSPELLLSSEWDYVPFAYPQSLEDLRSFVLIGMPATEAASALLVPLAAHELGHAVWRNRGIGASALAVLQARCVDLYSENMPDFKRYFPEYRPADMIQKELLPEAIGKSVEYALFQVEELFCDMFAYSLFGESYLYAFAYILAPGSGRVAGSKYPSYKTRIEVLNRIGLEEGVTLPDLAALSFAQEATRRPPREGFILRMAEASVDDAIDGQWRNVVKLVEDGRVCRPNRERAAQHLEELRLGIPAHQPRCLGDIINSGWMYYNELKAAVTDSNVLGRRVDNLNEMLLKTIEVLEFSRRTNHGSKRQKAKRRDKTGN